MEAFRFETQIQADGSLVLRNLPIQRGQAVEVFIWTKPSAHDQRAYPLRGLPYTYLEPFTPVALEDWEVLK